MLAKVMHMIFTTFSATAYRIKETIDAVIHSQVFTARLTTTTSPTQTIPRRGYFPQPGVVAPATTPGEAHHHDLYPEGIAFQNDHDFYASICVDDPTTQETAFRVQVLIGIVFPG